KAQIADGEARRRWVNRLDVLIVVAVALAIPAIGFDRSDAFHGLFIYLTSEAMLGLLSAAGLTRLCLAYPRFLPTASANLVDTIRSQSRTDAFWLGLTLTVIGFCYSLGWNFFFYRLCYDLIPMFNSIRVVTRCAMILYLGLALLVVFGLMLLAQLVLTRFRCLPPGLLTVLPCFLL